MHIATIIGNLTKDADVKTVDYGVIIDFTVARNEKTRNNEQRTEYISCRMYKRQDNISKYLTKGTQVAVSGAESCNISEHNGKHYLNINVRVDSLKLLGSGNRAEQQEEDDIRYDNPF